MFKKYITKLSVITIFALISLINIAYTQDASTWMPDANLRTAVRETLELVDDDVLTQAKMLDLTSLNATNLEITSISGLEHATNLKSLSIGNNQISDISPLTGLTSLTGLYIGSNQISDISPLANLVNLKRLGMLRNQISDISVLAGLINLESLKFAGNPITDTSSVVNLPKLSNVDIEIPSIIPDANLRTAVREALDLEENLRITPNAMKNLSTLNATNLEITSISGLEHATNLRSLSIGNNQISDISPLTDLTSLTGLYIGSNQISDISPLANLVNLKRLGMLRNQISDISVLAGLVNLESLKLAGNPITDTSVLADLPKLVDVDIEVPKPPGTKSPQDEKPPKDEPPQVDPNRAPVTVGTISGRTLTAAGASVSVDVSANFQDPDSDSLSYSAVSNDMDVVTLSVAGAEVTLTPHNTGSAIVTVTASDGELTAIQNISVTVTAAPIPNRAPVTVGAISARTLTAGSASVVVDVSASFSDPDSDSLIYSASSDNTDIATVSVAGAEVTITPHSAGSAIVTVTASDGVLTAIQNISVTVTAAPIPNRAPVTVGAISARTLTAGSASVRVNVSGNFQDPDNDSLSYSVSSDNTDIVTVSVSGSQVTLTPYSAGSAVVTVTASDGELTATQTITVSVVVPNRAPVTVGAISARTLTAGSASVRVNVSGNFQDPDNDDLSYSVSSDNTGIVSVSVSNALVTLTPVGAGNAVVTVTASDGKLTATQSISVSVVAANRAPVAVGAISARTLTVGDSSVVVDVSANFQDPDNDTLNYSVSSDNTGIVSVSVSNALVTLTPVGAGSAIVTVTASDGKLTATQTISVTITAAPVVNRAPVTVGAISARTLTAGSASVRVNVSGNFQDPDNDDLSYSVSSDNTGIVSVSVSNALVTLTPVGAGNAVVTVTASDGKLTATQSISVSVVAANRAPVAVGAISARTLTVGDSSVVVDVSSNFRDPDDDTLTYTASSSDTDIAAVSMSGSLVTITPEGTGNATITVTASDGELTATQSISVSVAAPNRAPVAVGSISSYTLIAGGSVVRVDVANNFQDPDNNTLTYTASSDDTNVATVSVSGSLVTITPEGAGDTSVTVTASDGKLTATQSISVSVAAPNRAPVAVGSISSYTLIAGGSVVRVDVSGNFSDPDDDTLTYTASSDDTNVATASVSGSLVTITPEGAGNTTVTVTASDGKLTATQSISVSVAAPNRAPVAVGSISSYTLIAGGSVVRVDVSGNFEDPDNNILSYSASSDNTGVVSVSVSGSLVTITPEGAGNTTVTVTANDGEFTATQSISVSVAAPNRAPVFTDGESTTRSIAENTASGQNIGSAVTTTDADNDTLEYTLGGYNAASFDIDSETGHLKTKAWLDYERKNSYTVTITVSDGSLTDSITVTINVNNVNDAPAFAIVSIVVAGSESPPVTRSVAENTAAGENIGTPVAAVDQENDTLTYTLSGDDASSFSIDSETGQLKTKAALDYEKKTSYSVTITVSDSSLTDTINVTINVTDVDDNRAPVFLLSNITRSIEIDGDTAAGANIGAPVSATDADNDTLTYTLGGTDAASFDIDSTTGQLQTTAVFISGTQSVYAVTVTANDGNGGSASVDVTVTATRRAPQVTNNAPVFQYGSSITLSVNKGEKVGTSIRATDEDDDTLTYSLGGTDASLFSLDEDYEYYLESNAALDYDGKTSYSVTITVSDGNGGSDTTTVTITDPAPEVEIWTTISREEPNWVLELNTETGIVRAVPSCLTVSSGYCVFVTSLLKSNSVRFTRAKGVKFDNSFGVTVKFSEEVSGFEQSELTLTNNTAGATISGWQSQETWLGHVFSTEVDVTMSGSVTFNVAAGVATDNAGQPNPAAESKTVTVTINLTEHPPWDVNEDGSVDATDSALVTAALGQTGEDIVNSRTDVNWDDTVDADDVTLVTYHIVDEEAAPSIIRAFSLLDKKTLEKLDPVTLQGYLDILRTESDGSPKYLRVIALLESVLASMRPDKTQLLPNYPNPFNPETWIPYHLAKASDVQITIYDARGVVVRQLDLGHQREGYYINRSRAAHWDGRNAIGERVASGLYFYQLQANNVSLLRKMVILK